MSDQILISRPGSVSFRVLWRLTIGQWTVFFVILGIVARFVRFAVRFPLSADEFMLAANLLDRGPLELLRPLDHNQVAPAGFLWIEWAAVQLFGFSEYSLRLFAAVCGIASVILFRHLAGRLLRGTALVFAVAIFSVAYYPLRYAAEIKPYASDCFVGLLLLAIAVEWWRDRDRVQWLWLLVLLAPVGLAISFPAVFVAGGIILAMSWSLWKERQTGRARLSLLAWLALCAAVVATFVGLQRLTFSAQYDAARQIMTSCWADSFPPWQRPVDLAAWLIVAHTSEMFAYPVGAENGGSLLTALCFAAGLWAACRRARPEPAFAIAAFFVLSLVAAALHRYPYGGHARLSQYLAPSICLLAGLGAARFLARIRRPEWQAAGQRAVMLACVVIGSFLIVRDLTKPWQSAIERDHRDFARTFWAQSAEIPTYCLNADLGVTAYESNFDPGYLCYRRIYSVVPPGREVKPGGPVPAIDRPLRCVSFHSEIAPRKDVVLARWMEEMSSRYDQVDVTSHEVRDQVRSWYDVYWFRPKQLALVNRQSD